jgi:CheY-like chemotaxis protein
MRPTPLPVVAARSDLEVLEDQLKGMSDWQAAFHARLEAEQLTPSATREMRLEARRRIEVLKRTQAALQARADRSVRQTVELLAARPARALLVHRNQWIRAKLAARLEAEGVQVLASLEDGADGLGCAIIEQPDLLLIEDLLPSVPGVELAKQARDFLPRAVIAAQVEDHHTVAAMLDAGAQAVFSRRVPPQLLAEQVADYLRQAATGQLLVS